MNRVPLPPGLGAGIKVQGALGSTAKEIWWLPNGHGEASLNKGNN